MTVTQVTKVWQKHDIYHIVIIYVTVMVIQSYDPEKVIEDPETDNII